MVDRLMQWGWRLVECCLLLISLCVLLQLILGSQSGSFITAVSANAQRFLHEVDSGSLLGLVLIVALYWFFRRQFKQ
jgi:H+/gluconate symporter-like permease